MSTAPEYYDLRAPYYDALYSKPERQADLGELKVHLQQCLAGRQVLEIACGTGYWTQAIAETARHITATDINQSMLGIARAKHYPAGKVDFSQADMYQLQPGPYDALFGGFIWSHIPVQELSGWLEHLQRLLPAGGAMVFVDNRFADDSNTPIHSVDAEGNKYQKRFLPDGSEHLVMKNFPDRAQFAQLLPGGFKLLELDYYWLLEYSI